MCSSVCHKVDAVSPEAESESEDEVVIEGTEGEKIRAQKEEDKVRQVTDPRKPTEKEVELHSLTHLPYRNWCSVCIAAKGKDLDHRKDIREERGLPEFSFDYCFPGDEFGYRLTILVGRERATGMTFASVVPEKGSKGKFVADRCLEFFAECGCRNGDIILKTDQEPAIAFLIKDLVAERGDEQGCRTLVEQSPVGSSGSNGVVERAVQTVEGQVRVLKLALEGRLGMKVTATSNIVTFLAEYAAYLVNRLEVGKDGKTAVERNKGKVASVMGIEFGEKLMFRKRLKDKSAKIEPRWEKGIFVGVRVVSGEFWIATPEGIRKARSVRRLPVRDRWSMDSISWVKHVPWHLYKGDANADGDIPEEQLVDPQNQEVPRPVGNLLGEGIVVKTRQTAPRAFQIRKEDAEKHGYTRGCSGCSSWFRGLGRQPHSPQCRSRFEELLKSDARFQNAERRKAEFEDKMREKAVKKARREEEKGQRRQREQEQEEKEDADQEMPHEPVRVPSSSSSGPLQPAPPARATQGDEDNRELCEQAPDAWEDILRKIKRPRAEGDMEVSVVKEILEDMSEVWLQSCEAPSDEVCETRAEIIEEIVAAKLWSRHTGECLKMLEGRVSQYVSFLSGSGGRHILPHIYDSTDVFGADVCGGFLPDTCCGTDVFGVDVCGDFAPILPEYLSAFEESHSREVSAAVLDRDSGSSKKLWADSFEDSSDLEKYVEDYWREDLKFAWDDVNGGVLDLEKVREARNEEVNFMKEKGIWQEASIEDAWRVTGKAPVSVKWVDTLKSGGIVRSRLVARDFRVKGDKDREDLFAATPPLELLKALVAKAAMNRRRKILVIDVKKAHLYPLCLHDVFIELPDEAGAGPGVCGRLVHWLYGFRPAAQAWESDYAEKLISQGYSRGVASPVVFWNTEEDISCLVHGDDFTFVGDPEGLDKIEACMKAWYEVKVKARLGCEEGDAKEVEVLGRTIRCTSAGYEFEADPGHRNKVLESLGFADDTKELLVNGKVEEDDGPELEGSEATAFRAIAARLNYLSQDAPDIQFAAKEVCREMSRPSAGSWRKLKVLARFLLGREKVVWKYDWFEGDLSMQVYSDSDWAGCRRTRRSTSGGVALLGGQFCLKTWSSTQAPIALSSAEAEYYAMVEAATRALGMCAMLAELGIRVEGPIRLHSDASAARSFASRRGVGKMRHLETRHLWLQSQVASREVVLCKVAGEDNPADLLTKYLHVRTVEKHLLNMSILRVGRNRETIVAEGGCQQSEPQLARANWANKFGTSH
jgi:hypothetical protein